jgi:hypothetical protein
MFLRWTVRKLAKPKRGEMKVVERRSGKRTGPMVTLAHWRPDERSEWRQDISWSANIVTCRRLNGSRVSSICKPSARSAIPKSR